MSAFDRSGPGGPDPETVARLVASSTQTWAPPGVVDLGIGQPDSSLLPAELFARAMALAPVADRHPLQYGGPYGDGYFRLALGEFLASAYGIPTDPEAIFVTNGNSQAIELVCSVFAEPGDVVFVEEPTYFLALDIFRRRGLTVVGIPVDDDGMSIDALEAELAVHRPAFVYTIPAFQNPTGATLAPDRRRRLVELASERRFLIVADEVYQLLDFGDAGVEPMAASIGSGVVLSLGTFSKILAPGLRLGWIQAAMPLLDRLATTPFVVSGGGLNPFASAVVRPILERGWQQDHLTSLRVRLGHRRTVMDRAIRAHLPPDVEFRSPTGGYFFWLRFPGERDTSRWLPSATERQVGYRPGALFSTGSGLTDRIRLSFAFYDSPAIEAAVATLGAIVGADRA